MKTSILEKNWHAYIAAYGPISLSERAKLLEQSVGEDVVFTNPAGDGRSRIGLTNHIVEFQKANAGMYFITDKLFVQKDKLLAQWSMCKPDGTKIAEGYNFAKPDSENRLIYLAGFF